jgi:hypothetical protein
MTIRTIGLARRCRAEMVTSTAAAGVLPMTESTATARFSKTAIAAQVAAVVGVLLCLAVVAAAWFGRGVAAQGVDDLAGAVDAGINRAITAADTVSGRLDAAAAEAGAIAADATEVAANPPAAPGLSAVLPAGLGDRLDRFTERYQQLRATFGEVRENVAASIARLQALARFVPGVTVPQGPADRLAGLETNLQSLDASVSAVRPSGAAVTTAAVSAAATAVADKATAVQGAIARTAAVVDGLSTELQGVRANAAGIAGGVHTILVATALAISILFAWVLLLNVALWRLARQRSEPAPVAVQPEPAPSPPPTAG